MEFDYIIIGAGSAGCVMANRLSANSNLSIALIEAGGADKSPMIHMPIGYGKTTTQPGESWHYFSQAEPHLGGRHILLPRGKGLGGSSNINGMIYIRGQRADYDQWAQLGATGWGWQDLQPYFKRSTRHSSSDSPEYGDGPLWVSPAIHRDPTSDAVISGFAELGVPENTDFNGSAQFGAGYFDANIYRGKRWSTAMAYLREAEARSNLQVIAHAHVRQILFDGKRASGIHVDTQAGSMQIQVRREIILCAGAYHSPQLLQLSGIGPAAHLKSLGIDVIADRAEVGANLQDHLIPPMAWELNKGVYSSNDALRFPQVIWNFAKYLTAKKGPMANPAAPVGAFVKSDPALDQPDIQFHCLPLTGDLERSVRGEPSQISPYPGFSLGPYFLRPESRGTAMAASPDAHDTPAITHNYLAEAHDRHVTLRAMQIARQVMATDAMRPLVKRETDPGRSAQSDDELMAFARQYGLTGYHPVGTCRMGADKNAVVTPKLLVNGAEGLRVADASVMPRLISGNTHAATVMIAEKASDIVLQDV